MRYALKLSRLQLALLVLCASAALQFACFARWPGAPMYDLGYSIFAAQNLVAHGQLKSLNVLADYHDDLAQFAHLRWMVHFAPGHSILYAAAMAMGLSPGAATKALVLAGILAGGLGWIVLGRFLGGSRQCLAIVAAFYPWLPWAGSAYQLYETEHVALALMPWFCLALLRIAPISDPGQPHAPGTRPGVQLLIVFLLALALIAVKHSMSALFPAAGLYLLLRDGTGFTRRPTWWKAGVAGLLVFPLLQYQLVNFAYGPRITQTDARAPYFAFQFVRNLLDISVSGTLGWNNLVPPLAGLLRLRPLAGLIDILSVVSLAIAVVYLRRHSPQGKLRAFGLLLLLLTITLWLSLAASTWLGEQQWDFSAAARYYMPFTLMWLLFGALSLDTLPRREMVRAPAFHMLALPVLLTALFTLKVAIAQPVHPAMPQSRLAWMASSDANHAAFVSRFAAARGRKPDLLISLTSVMNELGAPSLSNGQAVPPGHHYWSSTPLEVWALVLPSQEKVLLDDFAGASVERIATPAGYPFRFFIFRFEPQPSRLTPRQRQSRNPRRTV